jgi:hypothetical protein
MKLLARARFAANEHGGRGAGHLRHLLVERLHRAAGADDVAELSFARFLAKLRVLLLQPLPLGLHEVLDTHRVADERAGHHQQLAEVRQGSLRPVGQQHTQRARGAALGNHRHADERGLARPAGPERAGAVEEQRLAARSRHDNGPPRLHDTARDAFPELVPHALPRLPGLAGAGHQLQLRAIVTQPHADARGGEHLVQVLDHGRGRHAGSWPRRARGRVRPARRAR